MSRRDAFVLLVGATLGILIGGAIYGWLVHDAALVISICSVIIAAVALVTIAQQNRATIEHNRLSVRPRLTLTVDVSISASELCIKMCNPGFGPAIIKDLVVFLDGKPIQGRPDGKEWETVFGEIGQSLIGNKTGFEEGETVGPGEKYSLLDLSYKRTSVDVRNVLKAMEKVCVRVRYGSLYDESFEVEKDFSKLKA